MLCDGVSVREAVPGINPSTSAKELFGLQELKWKFNRLRWLNTFTIRETGLSVASLIIVLVLAKYARGLGLSPRQCFCLTSRVKWTVTKPDAQRMKAASHPFPFYPVSHTHKHTEIFLTQRKDSAMRSFHTALSREMMRGDMERAPRQLNGFRWEFLPFCAATF